MPDAVKESNSISGSVVGTQPMQVAGKKNAGHFFDTIS